MNLLKYIFRYKILILITIILLVLEALCFLLIPFVGSIVIDYDIQQKGIVYTPPDFVYEQPYKVIKEILPEEESRIFTDSYTWSGQKDDKGKNYYYLNDYGYRNLYKLETIFDPAMSYFYNMNIDEQRLSDLVNGNEISSKDEINKMKSDFQSYKVSKSEGSFYVDTIKFALNNSTAFQIDFDQLEENFSNVVILLFILILIVYLLSSIGSNLTASYISYKNSKTLREKLFNKVLSFGGDEFDKFSNGSLITRSTNDIQNIQNACLFMIKNVLVSPLFLIIAILSSYYIAPNLAWIIWIVFGLIIVSSTIILAITAGKFKHIQKLIDKLNTIVKDYLNGIFIIRAYNYDQKQIKKFNDFSNKLYKKMVKTNSILILANPVLILIINLLCVFTIWISKDMISNSSISIGSLTAFMFFSIEAIMSFVTIAITLIFFPRAEVSSKRIEEVLKCKNSIEFKSIIGDSKPCNVGEIEFKNVSFKYKNDDNFILNNASFKIPSKSLNMLVGPTGGGKSTLLKLILRYYEVTDGEILINNINIKNYTKQELYSMFSYVPQKTSVFTDTISNNINLNKTANRNKDISEVLKDSQLQDMVKNYEDGAEHLIAQNGFNISGGQKQRVNIARALWKNSQIMLLDDPFSSVDYRTEQNLMDAINENYNDNTIILSSQRLDAIKSSDNIIFINSNGNVSFDKHETLINSNEEYRKMVNV